jgi:hypothetical protein
MVCKILSPWSDEGAGTPKSVAQIAVTHFSILQSPHSAGCGTATSGHCGRRHPRVKRLFAFREFITLLAGAFFIRQWR